MTSRKNGENKTIHIEATSTGYYFEYFAVRSLEKQNKNGGGM